MTTKSIQVNFHHGQLDSNLLARQDSAPYKNGLILAENWMPLPQGGFTRRPGFTADAEGAAGTCVRLLTWEFDEDEQYLIGIGPSELRIWFKRTNETLDFLASVSMSAYWGALTTQEIRELQYEHRHDTIIFCHPAMQPIIAKRTGLYTFVIQQFDFGYRGDTTYPQEPFFRYATPNITMQPCDAAGAAITEAKAGSTIYMKWAGTDLTTGAAYDPSYLPVGGHVRYNGVPCRVTAIAASGRVKVTPILDLPQTKRIQVQYHETTAPGTRFLKYETIICSEDNGEAVLANSGTQSVTQLLTSLVNATYKWTQSPAKAGEYYLEAAAGGDPGLAAAGPNSVYENDVLMTNGTVGSLAASEWDWGDNDTLGYNTVYVRTALTTDPDVEGTDYIEAYMPITATPAYWIDFMLLKGKIETDSALIIGAETGVTVERLPVSQVIIADEGVQNMAATVWWDESAFSDYRGWPGCVTFFQQRLWFAGSYQLPYFLCASHIDNYWDFTTGTAEDDQSIQVVLGAQNPGRIRALVPGRNLQIFTTTQEAYIAEREDTPITPRTVSIRTTPGGFGLGTATPVSFAGSTLFVQRGDNMLRAANWDDLEQQYNSPPIGFAHESVISGIVEISSTYDPGTAAQWTYIVRATGECVLMFEIKDQEIRGFWPWTGASAIKSVQSLGTTTYVLMGSTIYKLDFSTVSEQPSCAKTLPLVLDRAGGGTTRGEWIRQGGIELDVVNTNGLYVNGRLMRQKSIKSNQRDKGYGFASVDQLLTSPKMSTTGKLVINKSGWTVDPVVTLYVEGTNPATILSINQEVSF